MPRQRRRLPPTIAMLLILSSFCLYCVGGIGPLTPSVGCVKLVDFLVFAGVPATAAIFVAITAATRRGRIAAFLLAAWFVLVPSVLLMMLGCGTECTSKTDREQLTPLECPQEVVSTRERASLPPNLRPTELHSE